MSYDNSISGSSVNEQEKMLDHLVMAIEELKKWQNQRGSEHYASFLHGQIHGIALTLRILYPGPGNWGEKAAFLVRPVITEHSCGCGDNH